MKKIGFMLTLMLLVVASFNSYAQTVTAPSPSSSPSTGGANSDAMQNYFINLNDIFDQNTVCGAWFNENDDLTNPRVTIKARSQSGIDALDAACNNYYSQVLQGNGTASANAFINAVTPSYFISFKLDSLLFAQTENDNVMDRMQALRRKQKRGNDDATLYSGDTVGGGASADDSDELSNNRLGLWFRANGSGGTKDVTLLTGKFDNNQVAGAVGMDYRLGTDSVLGGSLGYRNAEAKFGDGGAAGNMDSKTLTVAAYFSRYLYKNLYLDTVLNYGNVKYDTKRNILDLSSPPVLYTATGKTNGTTLSGGMALGYEFATGAWTIAPSAHYFYTDSNTDAFEEAGSGAFDLDYSKQHYHSSSARIDFNVSYAISSDAAVWLPHLRTEWIKEFGANVDTFDVRFVNANDPALAPLPIQMDKLDDQYFRMSLGISAQFRSDVSAYLDYQQLIGFDQVTFFNVVGGLRFQF